MVDGWGIVLGQIVLPRHSRPIWAQGRSRDVTHALIIRFLVITWSIADLIKRMEISAKSVHYHSCHVFFLKKHSCHALRWCFVQRRITLRPVLERAHAWQRTRVEPHKTASPLFTDLIMCCHALWWFIARRILLSNCEKGQVFWTTLRPVQTDRWHQMPELTDTGAVANRETHIMDYDLWRTWN
jgi:hypothetical protein